MKQQIDADIYYDRLQEERLPLSSLQPPHWWVARYTAPFSRMLQRLRAILKRSER